MLSLLGPPTSPPPSLVGLRGPKSGPKIILVISYTYGAILAKLNLTTLDTQFTTNLRQFSYTLLSNPGHRDLLPRDSPQPRRALRNCNKL